jgi:ATP-dependent Lhr-like helicase
MSTSAIKPFHPLLQAWFSQTFGQPTDVQRQSWEAITAGKHTLIAAPTGSGKTLAALLPCVNASLSKANRHGSSPQGVETLYITPLKALNNDIQHHVIGFGEQLEAAAEKLNLPWPGYRSAVRTGDTTPAQRRAMLKNPPQLLITTPESLFILLTSDQGRGILRFVKQVIIDEIHDLAGDKRGSHLSLSLERLAALTGRRIQRIGVSATQKPLSAVTAFLGGWMDPENAEAVGINKGIHKGIQNGEETARSHSLGFIPRPVHIVESAMDKRLDVVLCMPQLAGIQTSREAVWGPLLKTMFSLMEGRRSVLVFVNSRRLCERLVLRINDFAGIDMARSHHGSMSKELRLEAEARLKSGDLRCLVATSSLELGIDVGHIDLVIQIDSPLSAASGIQRIGRAGHSVGDISTGVIVTRYRGALPEAAVLGKCIAERDIDAIVIPRRPIDVLSQQTIAIAGSAESPMNVADLHRLVAGSDSYRELDRVMLEEMLNVLAGFYPFSRPILDWNRERGEIAKRGNTAIAALRGAGTIPQSSQYPVHHIDSRTHLGELDEEFVLESRVGDVFLLGTNSWMIRQIDKDRVYVSESANSFSEIPFWRNEGPGRSFRLGKQIGLFMETLSGLLRLDSSPDRERGAHWSQLAELSKLVPDESVRKETYDFLRGQYGMDDGSATELMSYVASQHAVSELPTGKRIVVEHYRDMMNQTHVVVLNHFGRRINRTWLLALQRQFELLLPYTLYGNAKDNGIEFVLPEWDVSWLRVLREVMPGNVEQLLMDGMSGSPLLAIAFRRIAETGLLLARSFTRTPMWQMRLRSEELLRESLPYADKFPFLAEAMRECLHDYLDVDGLKEVLASIQDGSMTLVIRETAYPSPMATQFLADYVNMKVYEGDGLNLETQASLLAVSRELASTLFGPDAVKGVLTSSAIQEEKHRLQNPAYVPGSAASLLELLKQRGESSVEELSAIAGPHTSEWVTELSRQGAIASLTSSKGIQRWYCAEERDMYESLATKPEAAAFVLNRYTEGIMSFSSSDLTQRYPVLTPEQAEEWIRHLSKHGRIVPTPFQTEGEGQSWSSSRIVERLVKSSLREARSQIQPVNPWRWCGMLAERQLVGQGTSAGSSQSIVETLRKLQGLYMPVSHWESLIFPARIPNYRKEELDMLCSAGELIWLGDKGEGRKEGKVAFFLSDQAGLYTPIVERVSRSQSSHPELLELLKTGGAAFLTGLSRNYGRPPSETLSDLLVLVWEGHASNDQFAPLRVRKGKNSDFAQGGSGFGRWYWTGSLAAPAPGHLPQTTEVGASGAPRAKELAESALGWLHQLLEGYGIITKELVHAVSPFSWDDMLPLLGKLEEWGTVVRGRFIEGQSGMQFAPPGVASRLDETEQAGGDLTVLSALDPANPFGLMMDWPDTPGIACARKTGSYLVVGDGKWRFWIENNGKRIYSMNEDHAIGKDDTRQLRKVFSTILHTQRLTKIVIEKWNKKAVAETEAADMLQAIGAERDGKSFVLWMSRLQDKA